MNKKTMIVVVAAVAGIIAYVIYKKRKQQASGSPAATTPGTPAVTTDTNPVTGQTTNTYTAAGGYPVPVAVTNWAKTIPPNNQAQFFKSLPSMTAGEINALYDIIINAWGKGLNATAAQSSFWDTWRQKYHIMDGTFNNFTNGSRRKRGQKLAK